VHAGCGGSVWVPENCRWVQVQKETFIRS
jgi:hypothetical protein